MGEGLISRRPQHSPRGAHSYVGPGSFSLTASHSPHQCGRALSPQPSTAPQRGLSLAPPGRPRAARSPGRSLTFWMAAGVISPFPRCRGAANATDMSRRCRQQGPTRARPLTRTPRRREAAAIRERSCAGGGAAQPAPAGEKLRWAGTPTRFSTARREPRGPLGASRSLAEATGPRAGRTVRTPPPRAAPTSSATPLFVAALVRSDPALLSAGRAVKWYGRQRGRWEQAALALHGAALLPAWRQLVAPALPAGRGAAPRRAV